MEFGTNDVFQDRKRLSIPGYDPGRRGYAYGVEVLLRHPIGDNWFSWISYSYQRSARLETFIRFDDQNRIIGTATAWVPFAFEQQHVLNATLSYKLPHGWTLGAVVHFNTGRPETGDLTSRSFHEGSNAMGQPIWVYDDRDRVQTLPSFFRIDGRVAKAWTNRDYTVELSLDMLNASLSQETVAYIYGTTAFPFPGLLKQPIKVPVIVPLLGVKGTY